MTGTPSTPLVPGTNFHARLGDSYTITALGTGTGGAGTYTVNTSTGLASGAATAAASLWSSGTPGNMFTFGGFYFTAAPTSANAGGGALTARTQAALGDFMSNFGTENATGAKRPDRQRTGLRRPDRQCRDV